MYHDFIIRYLSDHTWKSLMNLFASSYCIGGMYKFRRWFVLDLNLSSFNFLLYSSKIPIAFCGRSASIFAKSSIKWSYLKKIVESELIIIFVYSVNIFVNIFSLFLFKIFPSLYNIKYIILELMQYYFYRKRITKVSLAAKYKYVKYIEKIKTYHTKRIQLHSCYRRKFSDARTNCHPIPCCVSEEISLRVEYRASRWEHRWRELLPRYKNMPFLLCCFSLHVASLQNCTQCHIAGYSLSVILSQ